MELKRNLSAAQLSSASACSDAKRRATPTPTEDSPLGQLFNDESIHVLMDEAKDHSHLIGIGKRFLISLQGLVNNSTNEEIAKIIYDKARHFWEFEYYFHSTCTYAIDQDPSLSNKLIFYSNNDTPVQRMDFMKKDPWLEYILGDRVLGLKGSDAFIRGFLSILISYWNVKDLLYSSKLAMYRRLRPPVYIPPVYEKFVCIQYVIHHVEDFQNLREVLESKYGSNPGLVATLFEQIRNIQVNSIYIAKTAKERAMIEIMLCSDGFSPPYPAKSYICRPLPCNNMDVD
ncbi:hypothetical protein CASFOL_039055 [Castilleja foliolosa]|uniref:Uncharacterized protein n=1 Tax=Castilleja foliolosa TaxID=1961234 RepID=A0ABD3BHY5_9LAMI